MRGKNYSGLILLKTFDERFNYLALDGVIGYETLGSARYIAQRWYASPEWKALRDQIILRDDGCELGVEGFPIMGKVYIHHIEPITREDLLSFNYKIRDPENLICCSYDVHQAIHYGNIDRVAKDVPERTANDTCPWKR